MADYKQIIVASKNASAFDSVQDYFGSTASVLKETTREGCLAALRSSKCDVAFIDIGILTSTKSSPITAAECLDDFLDINPEADIVILCSPELVRTAVQVVRSGACGYLIYPVHQAEVSYIVQSTSEFKNLRLKIDTMQEGFWRKEIGPLIKTDCPPMQKVISAAQSVAQTDSTVLITGETGTGKGVLARIIHQHSSRKEGPFISVHCGAIPENLIESELFGHEKGSFTGAYSKKMGKFELASGGTIFLDEVGTMSVATQIKLLKVLQERIIQRVGSQRDIAVDVRVIAAANRDLKKLCEQDLFRTDLYYRLNVFPLELPPLHARREDIPHIANTFLKQLNRRYGKGISGIRNSVVRGFLQYRWPGNIRELENVIERAYVLESSPYLTSSNFPPEIVPHANSEQTVVVGTSGTLADIRQQAVHEIERRYLSEKLSLHQGRINKTAEEAGITPRQLHKLLVKYNLKREQFIKKQTSTDAG